MIQPTCSRQQSEELKSELRQLLSSVADGLTWTGHTRRRHKSCERQLCCCCRCLCNELQANKSKSSGIMKQDLAVNRWCPGRAKKHGDRCEANCGARRGLAHASGTLLHQPKARTGSPVQARESKGLSWAKMIYGVYYEYRWYNSFGQTFRLSYNKSNWKFWNK